MLSISPYSTQTHTDTLISSKIFSYLQRSIIMGSELLFFPSSFLHLHLRVVQWRWRLTRNLLTFIIQNLYGLWNVTKRQFQSILSSVSYADNNGRFRQWNGTWAFPFPAFGMVNAKKKTSNHFSKHQTHSVNPFISLKKIVSNFDFVDCDTIIKK